MTAARDLVPLGPRPELAFEARIAALEAAIGCRLSYCALRLEDGAGAELRADEPVRTASVIKLALCCALLDLVARGEASLDEQVELPPPGERSAGGGILKQLEVSRLSLRDLVELTICLSDNVATNAVLERAGGAAAVTGYLERIGLHATRLHGPVDFARIDASPRGAIGTTTPREQVALLAALARDELLTPALCAYLRGVLRRQHYQDQLPRWLGWNPYAQYHGRDVDLRVGNKSGELDGLRADVGLVSLRGRGTLAVAIFTDGGGDLRETSDAEGTLAVAECSAALAAHLLDLPC